MCALLPAAAAGPAAATVCTRSHGASADGGGVLGAGRAARVASVSPAAHAQPAAPPWCVDRPALGWPPAADASAVAPLPPTATHRAVLVAVCYLQVVPPVSSRPPRPPLPGAASGAHAAAAPRWRRAVAPPRGWLRWPPDRASPLGHAGSCVAAASATLPSHPRSNADAASSPPSLPALSYCRHH